MEAKVRIFFIYESSLTTSKLLALQLIVKWSQELLMTFSLFYDLFQLKFSFKKLKKSAVNLY